MNSDFNSVHYPLLQQLFFLKQEQFTGKLIVQSVINQQWTLYFFLGRLIWADGGVHPYRSWQRHLQKYCSQVQLNPNEIVEAEKFECWNYFILNFIHSQKLVSREQLIALINSKIEEILFDILQDENKKEHHYSCQLKSANFLLDYGFKVPITVVNIEDICPKIKQNWSDWCEKGLQDWSPNLALKVINATELEQTVSPVVFKNFLKLFNGQQTLRDLANQMNRDWQQLAYSLSIYVHKRLLEFVEVADLPQKIILLSSLNSQAKAKKANRSQQPLIVCIDDSPQICQIMKHIVTKSGYQFLGIQDALQAVPTLIPINPSLIFLDLAMPIINGYEVCSQIRRTSKLKDTPVIILTSNDGVVDRVRAKMVGASGFLAKPINIEKITETLDKFVAINQVNSSQNNS